ncbi:MAG: alpha-amylase family glycosyl hydrolase [Anaerolineaceae bacterium]|nr:alpha-amylase family glycosyl hydrolase [Anaerolineaceae bacterium]
MELHLSRPARNKYQFESLKYSKKGKIVFPNHQSARQFANQVNEKRAAQKGSENYVAAGQINALATIESIFHHVLTEYYAENGASLRTNLYADLAEKIGKKSLDDSIQQFLELFPPQPVYEKKISLKEYLNSESEGIPHKEIALEEMLMDWLSNQNPAAEPYSEFFDNAPLKKNSAFDEVIKGTQDFFAQLPPFGPEQQDLVSMLRAPAIAVPDSLKGQLQFIREHWGKWLGDYLLALLGSLDMLKEDEKLSFMGPGPTQLPDYADPSNWADLPEIERFSKDSDWMPRVVMIAKNSFVWLSQLSREYGRPIERLDQIPDETLDELARCGFTGLWLIGLWERSDASRRIKQMCGNPDAVSSAYSLSRYQIADRLGGNDAYLNLSHRCGNRGIRLASDMVPNHMGIDSDWVYEHPDWFISQDFSPFPSYTFNGPDLSQNPNISINLEDHYYTRSDAAVVFKRYEHSTGRTSFFYHGNDGTSMPWNDTAQLDYLNPQVREAVIQTILDVARKFPIIRFDAAMTLTKKHYQRLWFPVPGSGGDIPSRAEHAMKKADFDRAMPEEFWLEVVERVAKEVPDTLLLAEAFWMMEGYFVRSLGMHRVYNSAFMNMLRNEENGKYRQLIKSTLVYDPQILQRYVNFMNNPDEKTAVEQFGKGEKYFGICTLMSTMPGLPMFGHGQFEGYAEKYGMEYYRPYLDETPDRELMHQHAQRIVPILHQRWLFANVDFFRLYDFQTEGSVDENVFAYSNSAFGKSALVVYNNRYGSTAGWVNQSCEFLVKGQDPHLESCSLAEALGLQGRQGFLKYRDNVSKLTYLRPVSEVQQRGLYFQLDAYAHQVLHDFEIVDGQYYEQIYNYLGGRGVWDLDALGKEIALQPVLEPLRHLLAHENLSALLQTDTLGTSQRKEGLLQNSIDLLGQVRQKASELENIVPYPSESADKNTIALLKQVMDLDQLGEGLGLAAYARIRSLFRSIQEGLALDPRNRYLLLIWALLSKLMGPVDAPSSPQGTLAFLDEAAVQNLIQETLRESGFSDHEAWKNTQALKWMIAENKNAPSQPLKKAGKRSCPDLAALFEDPNFRAYLDVNRYNEIDWYNGERFENMIFLLTASQALRLLSEPGSTAKTLKPALEAIQDNTEKLKEAASGAEYQVEKLLKGLS